MHAQSAIFSIKSKRIISICALVLIAGVALVFAYVFSPHLLAIVEDPEKFRLWVQERGFTGKLVMIFLIMIKVILPIIPGKPFEIAAGYAFGAFEGTLLCLIGAALGSYIVFGLVRVLGVKIFNLFYSREKLLSMKFLQDTERLSVWVFFIMLIPGTPKDFLSYFVALTRMKFWVWMIISPLARIPVVIMSTLGGSALGSGEYGFAIVVFVLSICVSVFGLWIYKQIRKRKTT